MIGKPKPTKQDRLLEKQNKKDALAAYRQTQAMAAIERDNDCCAFCWFLLGHTTKRSDVHHVYSRGKEAGDWREHYTNLLCTCRRHHPQPILTPVPDKNLAYVEDVLKWANEKPMNMFFRKENYD